MTVYFDDLLDKVRGAMVNYSGPVSLYKQWQGREIANEPLLCTEGVTAAEVYLLGKRQDGYLDETVMGEVAKTLGYHEYDLPEHWDPNPLYEESEQLIAELMGLA
jgi:hypothetical protein